MLIFCFLSLQDAIAWELAYHIQSIALLKPKEMLTLHWIVKSIANPTQVASYLTGMPTRGIAI
jgi:hypothetical protein